MEGVQRHGGELVGTWDQVLPTDLSHTKSLTLFIRAMPFNTHISTPNAEPLSATKIEENVGASTTPDLFGKRNNTPKAIVFHLETPVEPPMTSLTGS